MLVSQVFIVNLLFSSSIGGRGKGGRLREEVIFRVGMKADYLVGSLLALTSLAIGGRREKNPPPPFQRRGGEQCS